MESNIFKYVWRHSKREQVIILFLVLLSMPFYFLSLNLPKQIINEGIQGEGFEGEGSTKPFLAFDLPFGEQLNGAAVPLFDGFQLELTSFLLALAFAFLGFVIVNGAFKFAINALKGRLGERMLRRLRYELADRILRFPIPYTRRIKQAEVATYRDSSDRAQMFVTVDHPFLRGVLTTPERAIVVSELMAELPKHVSPGDALLLHGGCALVHLLAKTRPVLGSTWNGVYNSRMFSEKLRNYDLGDAVQPPILLSKGSCRARQWPKVLRATATEVQTRQELASYMWSHGYALRWQNAFFEIWMK